MIKIYDLETYPNFFLASFKDVETGIISHYEISDRKNDTHALREFLLSKIKLIGFNNINFDYPILHHTILSDKNIWTSEKIYEIVKWVLSEKYSSVWDNEVIVPQLDLYKIWHYDNKNKATSLKWLEFAMRMDNIEDLPYEPGSTLNDIQKDKVIEYCENDLEATYKFYKKSDKHIELRQSYSKIENMNLLNASEIKMSKKIFGKHLAKYMGIKPSELNKMQSPRKNFPIKDIIFDYIKFEDSVNQEILNKFKTYNWVDTSKMSKERKKKHAIKFTRKYKNVIREYAEGGLHSFGKSGIYESDDDYILIDVDFASYYPHLCFRNNLHPEHIPEETFNTLYEGFYTERKKYPKTDPRNYVLKIILNGSYGLSKDKYSFLYDPKLQMAICVNGQLILTMLSEAVFKYCSEETKIIFENTDGAMYRIKRSDIDNLNKACKEVEDIVDIPLETQECKKIIAADVSY